MRILVTGGYGFIGSNFIRRMLNKHKDINILNVDKETYSGNPDNLLDVKQDNRLESISGDIADIQLMRKAFIAFKPDYVINFAAETHVDRSIHVGSEEFIRTNIWGVYNILELIKEYKVIKYVQVSTDEVYGSLPPPEKFTETTPFSPNVPYSATKAGGDLLCRAYYFTWKLPVVVTHCSNNYGPYQYPEKLIPFFVLRMIEGKKIPIYGDGMNVRDWIHVDDHCDALELCLLKGKAGDTYNIGADNERTNLEIAKMILDHFKKDISQIEFVADRPGHDRRYAIDATKIKNELGWKIRHTDFRKAFTETIDWYLGHTAWVDAVRTKTGVFNPHIDLWKSHNLQKN